MTPLESVTRCMRDLIEAEVRFQKLCIEIERVLLLLKQKAPEQAALSAHFEPILEMKAQLDHLLKPSGELKECLQAKRKELETIGNFSSEIFGESDSDLSDIKAGVSQLLSGIPQLERVLLRFSQDFERYLAARKHLIDACRKHYGGPH